jgi:phytoene dehydrogenase-like protein
MECAGLAGWLRPRVVHFRLLPPSDVQQRTNLYAKGALLHLLMSTLGSLLTGNYNLHDNCTALLSLVMGSEF